MGNRAVITTKQKRIGIYLHWNGGKESVDIFLAYCDLKNYRCPEDDNYGWARLCQVIGNFFGGNTSIGIDEYNILDTDNGDNGVYVIEDWKVVERLYKQYADHENTPKELYDNLLYVNECQPIREQLDVDTIKKYVEDKYGKIEDDN